MRVERRRRSFVIIAVLVVMGSALFITTGALFIAQAEIAGAAGAGAAAQSRSLAWSGMQIVVGELNQQRDRILRGEVPRLDQQYEIYTTAGSMGVVRLLPVTPDGERLAPEAGKLDVNAIDAQRLANVGMLDEPLAEAIIAFRDSLPRPMHSIEEILDVRGATPELLYGRLDEMRLMQDALGEEGDVADRILRRLATTEPRGLADVLTVFAVEPPLQRDGRLRINLNVEWSEDLASRLDDRFGSGASEIVKEIIDGGTTFDSDRKIVEVLRRFELHPQEWVDILDALTAESGEYLFGKLNINTASEAALMGLPGITPEWAAQIVRARESLSSDERSTIVWPLLAGIVDGESFEELVEHITVRSWTYRVRIAAGEVDAEEPDGEMMRPVIWEAVVDLAAPHPRIAYLRDVTMLETVAIMAMNVPHSPDTEDVPENAPETDVDLFTAPLAEYDSWEWSDDLEEMEEFSDDQEPNMDEEGTAEPNRIGRWKPG